MPCKRLQPSYRSSANSLTLVPTGTTEYIAAIAPEGRRENTSFSSSSSLTVSFEACILVRVQFFSLSWRALARHLRLCVDPCPRYLTPDDTHNLCVFCLGKEHARDVLEGKISMHSFPWKEGQPSASRDSGPTAAEAPSGSWMNEWRMQMLQLYFYSTIGY